MISSGYVALDCGAIDIDWDNHYWRIFGINGALCQPSVCCVKSMAMYVHYWVRCGRVRHCISLLCTLRKGIALFISTGTLLYNNAVYVSTGNDAVEYFNNDPSSDLVVNYGAVYLY